MNLEMFVEELRKYHIELSKEQLNQFEIYYKELVDWNDKMNLTNITIKEEVYLKHFYDSLSLSFFHKLNSQSICDIGAGAGFPSIPLKIVFPDLNITIVDSLNKRITFLNHLIKELNLTNVKAIAARGEEYAINNRECFDIVSARAVARLNILSEICLPLVKQYGYFIALKGKQGSDELKEAQSAIELLGGEVSKTNNFKLPNTNDERINIEIIKVKKTSNKYPRHFSKIKKNPL